MTEEIKHEIEKGLDRNLSAEFIAEAIGVSVDDVNEISKDYTPKVRSTEDSEEVGGKD